MTVTEVELPEPGTDPWLKLMTGSKIAGVLGISPWTSAYSLWHQMKGVVGKEDGKNMKAKARGHYLEDGIIDFVLDNHPEITWHKRQFGAQNIDTPWAGATLDALTRTDLGNYGMIEAKTSAKTEGWGAEGTDEIPIYYYVQVQWGHAMCPEITESYVGVLLGAGLELREYVIPRDEEMIATLLSEGKKFVDSLALDECPAELDGSDSTQQTLLELYPSIETEIDVQVEKKMAVEFLESNVALKAAEERWGLARNKMLKEMGDAQYARVDKTTVARRQKGRSKGASLYPLRDALPSVKG